MTATAPNDREKGYPPEVEDVDFSDLAYLADPWGAMLRLQREAPVFYSEKQAGWIVSGWEDVRACYADRRLSASRSDEFLRDLSSDLIERISALRVFNENNVNRFDGSEHVRLRTLLMKAFDRHTIAFVESFLGEIVDDVLDECERLGEFDFMETVSAVVPARVMQRLFGLPDHYRPILFEIASDFVKASTAPKRTAELLTAADDILRRSNEMFRTIIDERRLHMGDDLVSRLVHARDGLNRLSDDELLANLNGLVIAGAETTANSLGTQLVEIARRPDLVATLRDTPERAIDIILELLRYPGTIRCFTRQAVADVPLGGSVIRSGDIVYIMNVGANVDPRVFPDPLAIDPGRPNLRDIMTFSPGAHHCVGHMLAKTTLVGFFTRLVQRFDVEILQKAKKPANSFIFIGNDELHVRFTPRGEQSARR